MGQHDGYADPKFGVEQCWIGDRTGALNGTVAATELQRYRIKKPMVLNSVVIRAAIGGTEGSVRKLIVGLSLAGTGAMSAFGTQALGTLANGALVAAAITGTLDAGDDLVLQHLGTGGGVYDVEPQYFLQERFVQA